MSDEVIKPGVALDMQFATTLRYEIALNILRTHPLVAYAPDGEDGDGHAKARRLEPQEIVDAAVEIADKFVDAVERMGWIRARTFEEIEDAHIVVGRLRGINEDATFEAQRELRKMRG